MNSMFPKMKISDILYHDTDSLEAVVPSIEYPMVGVYSFGKGLFAKEPVLGMNTSYRSFYRLKPEHIVMSQLFGWEGAIALSSDEFKDRYLSSQFPTFLVKNEIADTKYVGYYLQQRKIWKQLFAKGRGMGSRRRTLNPENLLSLDIELPPLPIQRSIVVSLETIKQKVAKVGELRRQQLKEIENLLFSKYSDIIRSDKVLPMRDVAPIVRREVKIDVNLSYPEVGIRSFGKGTFHKPALAGLDVGTKTLYQIKSGDLMFSNVFAWEGAIAIAKETDDNRFGSHRFISCVANKDKVLAEFLCYHFLTPEGLIDINRASPGGAGRNKTLGLEKLMRINVPVPEIHHQVEFVELLQKIRALSEEQKQTDLELDELMPSLFDKAFKGELWYANPEQMSEIKIEVRYYNAAQQTLFQGYPNATQLNSITQNHFTVSKDEFLSYMMFTEQDDSHSEYKTFKDLRDKVQHRLGDINNYLTLNNGSVQSKVTAQQMMAAGFTERLWVALGLTVVNKIHALTEADWKKIPESRGRGIKIKTFDFELPVASTGSNFIQAENKGAILANNYDQTGSVTTHYSGKHGILSKKTFVRNEEGKRGISLHQNLYYGTVGVLGTDPNSIARVWLVDPPAIDIEMEPSKYKLLARLSYYLDEFRAIGVREKLLSSLERRIEEITNSKNYLEFDNVPLEGTATGPIRKYMSSDIFSVIDTDEAYGKAFIVQERESSFVYIVAFAKAIIRSVIKQNFKSIIDFNYNPDFLRGDVTVLIRLDEKMIPEVKASLS